MGNWMAPGARGMGKRRMGSGKCGHLSFLSSLPVGKKLEG